MTNEYLAEARPDCAIWPRAAGARAMARALAAEMHSDFAALRGHLPMNMRRKVSPRPLTDAAGADAARLEQAFAETRAAVGAGGVFLFGPFTAADAMFAPTVNRLHVYDAAVALATRAYMDAHMALPAWRDWSAGAAAEIWTIEKFDLL